MSPSATNMWKTADALASIQSVNILIFNNFVNRDIHQNNHYLVVWQYYNKPISRI